MAESSTGRHGEAARGIARGLTHYGDPDFSLFIRGAYARGAGLTADDLARPIIGIAQTYSEFNPCHRHFREIAEAVKRGVLQVGGFPLEFRRLPPGQPSAPLTRHRGCRRRPKLTPPKAFVTLRQACEADDFLRE